MGGNNKLYFVARFVTCHKGKGVKKTDKIPLPVFDKYGGEFYFDFGSFDLMLERAVADSFVNITISFPEE